MKCHPIKYSVTVKPRSTQYYLSRCQPTCGQQQYDKVVQFVDVYRSLALWVNIIKVIGIWARTMDMTKAVVEFLCDSDCTHGDWLRQGFTVLYNELKTDRPAINESNSCCAFCNK